MFKLLILSLSLVSITTGCATSGHVPREERVKRLARASAAEIKQQMVNVNTTDYRRLSQSELEARPDAVRQGNVTAASEFDETLKACSAVLLAYEKKADIFTITRILLGATGAIAGGVLVPALTAAAPLANSTAISALGGVSGVTSGVLGTMSEGGMNAVDVLLARAKTRDSVFQALNEYYEAIKAGKPIDAGVALDKAKAACTLYEVTVPGQDN